MNKLKTKAFLLRKKRKSYNEISQKLGIAKSTLSYWFKENPYSSSVKNDLVKEAQKKAVKRLRLLALANKEKWEKIHLEYQKQANQEFPRLLSQTFFVPGLMIYWGEGDKKLKNCIVRVSNVDHRLLRIFIAFLIESCNIKLKKIRVWLLLYPDLDEKKCKKYWSETLNIPQKQFIKSHYILGREKKRKISHGVCSVQVYSRELKEKIIKWIDLYSQKSEQAGIV